MNLSRYILSIVKDELKAIYEQFRESKILVSSFFICLTLLIVYLDPFPTKNVSIGSSYKNSDWYHFGDQILANLQQTGLKGKVIATDGAVDNANRVADARDPLNAAFVYGIALDDTQRENIYSLGSISYEPLWIFYNKTKVKTLKELIDLKRYKVGLGPKLSGSYAITRLVFKDYGINIEEHPNFISDGFLATEGKFASGEVDALIMVSSVADPIVQKLIRTPGIGLYSFENAQAFEKNYNSFEMLKLPAGSINIYPAIPAQDVSLVATTTSLVVKRNMHPDMQLALLMAAKQMNRDSAHLFFSRRDEFPAYVDPLVPISPVASRFYDFGPPQAMRHLPFWIAGFIDRAWLLLLTLATVFYPLSKLNLRVRKLRFILNEHPHYEELLKIDSLLMKDKLTAHEKKDILARLHTINEHAIRHGVPIGSESHYFELLNSIYLIRRKLEDK